MTHPLLDGVAATTTHRDRDELDRAVARLLLQLLEPHSITLLRVVTDGAVRRVEPRVSMTREGSEPGSVASSELLRLGAPGEAPAWQKCVARGEVLQCDGVAGRPTTLFPIRAERDTVAILVVETSAFLSSRETDLVRGILEIVRNHLALLDYSELDTLTGLLNRKTFEGHFEKMRNRTSYLPKPDRSGGEPESAWLALIDIDNFKSINDTYGHLFGDEVLLLVSQLMRRSFRGADQLFRFGGEEFVVVLECASEAGARIALERLRTRIEEYAFPQVRQVSITVGYTRIGPQDVPALCVERADAALYYGKSHGRNNVRNFEALTMAGKLAEKLQNGEIELF